MNNFYLISFFNKKKFFACFIVSAVFIITIISAFFTDIPFTKNQLSMTGNINNQKDCVIVIDAGHGGVDGGAVAADGTVEKGINLDIAKKLQKTLVLFGFKTVMTRSDDRLIYDEEFTTIRSRKTSDIKNRLKLLEGYNNSILLSIHQNKFPNTTLYGTQVFYSPNNPLSEMLADSIQKSVVCNTQKDNTRKIKASGREIYLLYHTEKPAVMVECGFVSNVNELKKLLDEEYQQKITFSICCGLIDYFNSIENIDFSNTTENLLK